MGVVFLQLVVIFCFLGLVIVLFFEEHDYVFYSILLITISALFTSFFIPSARDLQFYINAIEWNVIFFLIAMFIIVEILKEQRIFEEIAKRIVDRYQENPRKLFYIICTISTLTASIIEDISIAIIFCPIIIHACRKLKITPAPYLLGMTVCINLAATLTPFGSAPNILIATHFNLNIAWFVTRIGLYFIITFISTLFILDRLILKKDIERCKNELSIPKEEEKKKSLLEEEMSLENKVFYKNLLALFVFILLLIFIPEIYLAGIIGALIFVVINPVKRSSGKIKLSLSEYLKKVDYRLIFFFMCLFIFVGLMDVNGTLSILERWIETLSGENELLLAIIILLVTSIASGFLDNTPITVIFLPIISILIGLPEFQQGPLMVAFILGVNLGGNFLPQGSAADMMTLQISQDNKISDLNYKRLFKVGGIFAILHVMIGIIYLTIMVLYF
ncbi:MAG: SLC13 family permease [Promethearchaeota archaeon]